jgi:DNA polymerase I
MQMLYDRSNLLFKGQNESKIPARDKMTFGRDSLGMSRRENWTTGFVWDVKGRPIDAGCR